MHGPFKPGDIVGVNHKGREYLAFYVSEVNRNEIRVQPIHHNITWFQVSKREVKALWRFTRGEWAQVPSR